MVRLRKIEVSGFRGARYPLTIDFTNLGRSMAIFGENATGKSTITDAVEWFFKNRVDHLWREDCKEDALRNVDIGEKDDTSVKIDFTDKDLSGGRVLKKRGNDYVAEETNRAVEFGIYIARATEERLVLRTASLTEFITKTKGKKREEIAKIIGYEAIEDFRTVIQKTQNSLEKDPDYSAAKKNLDTSKSKLVQLVGKVLFDQRELYATANEILTPFKIDKEICDDSSYSSCIEALKARVAQQDKMEKKLRLEALRSRCENLEKALQDTTESGRNFLDLYEKLIEAKEKIKLLDLEQFLSKGKDLLDKGLAEPGKCPFCGSSVDLGNVKQEVEKRVKELESIRRESQSTKFLKDKWIGDLRNASRIAGELENEWAGLDVSEELKKLIQDATSAAMALAQDIEEKFVRYERISENEHWKETRKNLTAAICARAKKADAEIKALAFTREEQNLLDVIQKLNDLKALFGDYQQNLKTKQAFESQIKTLARIKEEFTKVQNAALQNILDLMSTDISRYYLFMHPPNHEQIDKVRLRIVGEEGIEFEYSFHGKPTYPPMKYLSESHLNSLGIALFLASVKLINKENNFFILDDVVTSFDHGHRIRLLRLLKEEFDDWQIILLAHERFWFQIIKRELGAKGWILREVDWTPENGVQIKGSSTDYRELIEQKRVRGESVTSDMRILLEKMLKEICHSLEVKMAFCYNENNEERMVGELLCELRRTLKQKNKSLNNNPVFRHIETSSLLGTAGSHDRPQDISKGDIEVALQDIDELEKLFRCDLCDTLVSRKRFVAAERRVTCKCGALSLDWKD